MWLPSLILIVVEGWREKEICTKGASSVKNKERGRVGEGGFCPTPTVQSNSKSNMASWIKDQEIVLLAHTNKTSALQAKVRLLHLTHFPVSYVPVFCSYCILTSSVIYY